MEKDHASPEPRGETSPEPPPTTPLRGQIVVRNRQRTRRVDTALLQRLTRWVLAEHLNARQVELCLHLVGAAEVAEVNWQFLRHAGSTDVITFDHRALAVPLPDGPAAAAQAETRSPAAPGSFRGEIFISLDDAVRQARRFRSTWQAEVARYLIHGLLHLCGHDDLDPASRRAMKRAENRLLRLAGARFDLRALERAPRAGATV